MSARATHEALCYDSADDLLTVTVPFLLGGVAAGEPTVVALGEHNTALVRAALPATTGITFLGPDEGYARPAGTIRDYHDMLAGYLTAGATRVRVIGELPQRVLGATWDWWARYEATVNHAFDDFPVWSMCAYDTRVTPAPVLADVLRTHPCSARPGGESVPNVDYTDPVAFLREPRPPVPDPLQAAAPQLDLTDPSAAQARAAVRGTRRALLTECELDKLLLVVSEAVNNAHRHGRGTVRLLVWTGVDRVVAAVSDEGCGPQDPFAGLLPARGTTGGGFGLWLTHLFANHVTMDRRPDGYTLRITAGVPYWGTTAVTGTRTTASKR